MDSTLRNVMEAKPGIEETRPPLNQGIVQGDEYAFAQVISQYSEAIFRFLTRMVGNRDDAEDLTQETFFAFYRHHQKIRLNAELHPYLFTIARRKAISFLRWRKVRAILTPLTDFHESVSKSCDATPADSIEQEQTSALIQNALAYLTPDKRAAVILRYFEGLSYAKIAKIMEKPEGTAKSLVFRAEQELRRRLTVRLAERDR